MKIISDWILALIGLIICLLPLVLVAFLILSIDRQNPFFTQSRMGLYKKEFTIFKLRTMKNNSVTKLGKILRRTGLDELPQLLNILKLEMSFVGPRPLTTSDVERLGWNDPYHQQRWNCRPGLTGLSQLSTVCHKKMTWFLDKTYVQCKNMSLDLKILIASVAVLFVGKQKAANWLQINKRYARSR